MDSLQTPPPLAEKKSIGLWIGSFMLVVIILGATAYLTFWKKSAAPANWNGTWSDGNIWNQGLLVISSASATGFDFAIEAYSGGNMGHIDGHATIEKQNPDNASASVKESDTNSPTCELIFSKHGATISVRGTYDYESGRDCSAWGGIGVGFDYNYKLNYKIPEPGVEVLTALTTDQQRQIFTRLVGNDLKLFTESAMQQDDSVEILDIFPAKAVASGVTHLYTVMENIIMTTPDNKIWAAVIDPAGGGQSIKYFTNVAADTHKPPKTIQAWIDDLGYTVIYASAEK